MAFRGWEKEKLTLADGREVDASCPVIISASRSTDLPAFFSDWFINRVRAGYMKWTNPFNANQVQYISFAKTRLFVFWSKNPKPLIRYLPELDNAGFNYYFQFTINDYEKENLEPNVPPLQTRIETFKKLSDQLGKERVIWRYDPLVLSDSLSVDVLIDRITGVAEQLSGFTEKLVISFADIETYRKVQNNLSKVIVYKDLTPESMRGFAEKLAAANRQWGVKIATCAEDISLNEYGIEHNRCIDDELMVRVFNKDTALMNFLGYEPSLFDDASWSYFKDKGQRKICGCMVSKDIGMYNTCSHFCAYCYANASKVAVQNNLQKHHPDAESLV
jgi:hypothetical protein